jgi:DNA-binding NarL/FixJ family response regulator
MISKILIAEDDFIIREGNLRPLLETEYEIVAAVGDGLEAVAAAEKHKPDIALLDMSLPGMRGLEVARHILKNQPECRVLFVSCYVGEVYVEAAKELGASGYVNKSRIRTELVKAIRTAEGGQFYWPEP